MGFVWQCSPGLIPRLLACQLVMTWWLNLISWTSADSTCKFQDKIDPYTMYNDLHGVTVAKTSADCKATCCKDAVCQLWQWADDPLSPPNCWLGASSGHQDSGGVEWKGERTRASGSAPGGDCSHGW
jgi:hypothetical protein